eukprot:gene26573-32114_t
MNEAEQSDSDDPKATGVTTNSEQASSEKWQMDSEEYNDCMDEMEQYRDDEQDEKMPQSSGDANNPLANLRKRRLLKKELSTYSGPMQVPNTRQKKPA